MKGPKVMIMKKENFDLFQGCRVDKIIAGDYRSIDARQEVEVTFINITDFNYRYLYMEYITKSGQP